MNIKDRIQWERADDVLLVFIVVGLIVFLALAKEVSEWIKDPVLILIGVISKMIKDNGNNHKSDV